MDKKKILKPTIINANPPKSWWSGDARVEKYMPPVVEAIKRNIKWPSKEFTDIYNRAYEAVYLAIKGELKESWKKYHEYRIQQTKKCLGSKDFPDWLEEGE